MAVDVLALQGSFNEHMATMRRLSVMGVKVRKPSQLEAIKALIIPGGKSITMAKLAHYHNLLPALRNFVSSGKPVRGTCAGLIFPTNKATGQKLDGQELIGGLDCTVHQIFFLVARFKALRLSLRFSSLLNRKMVLIDVVECLYVHQSF